MRAAALLVLAALLLAAAPLAAASPNGPTPAAQDPTRLQALLPANLTAGQNSLVEAILEDAATGTPIAQENVTFSRKTMFGALSLGTSPTNAEGEAYLSFAATKPGNFTVVVAFDGDAAYQPSNASVTFTVLPAGAPPAAGSFPTTTAIVLVIVAVVGGVWVTYAFVAFLILGIRADRPEEEPTAELKEKESMADDDEKPQRAPRSANATSRTVAIVAAVALVLGGLAVSLAVVTTLGGTKAASYTPSTVTFDVSVVPDIRGDSYDSFLPDILVVHQGDTVKLQIFNPDGMAHGFAIDEFGVRVTVPASTTNATGAIVPSTTNVTFVATQAGSFRYYCTVWCGPGHDTMEGTLTVLPDD